jgi:hypothetical protein
MSLDSGTPKTDWDAADAVLTTDLERIEGNTQDLQDSKVENISGTVDLRRYPARPDEDVVLRFASDATLTWDESADAFVFSKSARVTGGFVVSEDGEIVEVEITTLDGSYNTSDVVPSGVYEYHGANNTQAEGIGTLFLIFRSNTNDYMSKADLKPGSLIFSDGVTTKLAGNQAYVKIGYKILLRRL